MSKGSKELILILLIVGLNQILSAILLREFYPVHLQTQQPFFFELAELHFKFPLWIFFIFNSLNILLLWFISRMFFRKRKSFVSILLFAISPWSTYLTVAGSFYIILLTLILLTVLGIIKMSKLLPAEVKYGNNTVGAGLFIAGSLLSLYSSIIFLLIFPFFVLGLIKFKLLSIKSIKQTLIIILFSCLPLFFLCLTNITGVKNIYRNQVTIFSDPGLMTAVNNFQGESKKMGLNFLTKLVENRYIYFGEYIALKAFKNITPATFFTPQEKLLKFSFTPPILIGLLIPFLYGLFKIFSSPILIKIFILSTLLIIPSLLSSGLVDLNRLVLFKPVIILITSLGLIKLSDKRILLYLIVILILVQLGVTIFDINQREFLRYERYLGTGFEI